MSAFISFNKKYANKSYFIVLCKFKHHTLKTTKFKAVTSLPLKLPLVVMGPGVLHPRKLEPFKAALLVRAPHVGEGADAGKIKLVGRESRVLLLEVLIRNFAVL